MLGAHALTTLVYIKQIETLCQTVQGFFSLYQSASRLGKHFKDPLLSELLGTLASEELSNTLDQLKCDVDFKAAKVHFCLLVD